MPPTTDAIVDYLQRSRDVVDAVIADASFIASLDQAVAALTDAFKSGNKLLICGNGGSAADAQHIAGEFIVRMNYDRPAIAALALSTDGAVLTATGNDHGYEQVFERQVLGLGRAGDVLLAISTSGRSPSILRAMEAARRLDMIVIALTGRIGGEMPPRADIAIHVPSDSTPLIQQIHITAAHIMCGLVEQNLHPR